MSYGDLTKQLLALSARPAGVGSADPELTSWTPEQVGNNANRMVRDGRLFRAKLSWRNVRYFCDPETARQYETRHREGSNNFSPARPNTKAPEDRRPADWDDCEMVITEKTVFTQCPNYTPRFTAMEMPGFYGGNQRGRVLKQESEA